ncbi:MAG TPA: hypothetical protein VGJ20_29005 [Xanthobacteraceae bacterium]|jgi:hypothetical protein
MNNYKIATLLCFSLLMAACKTTPQGTLLLKADTLSAQNGKVGIVMTAMPKVDTTFPGASCLLCLATASAANSGLTKHAHTMSNQDFAKLKEQIADTLRKKNVEVTVIAEDFSTKGLKDMTDSKPNAATKDLRPLKEKYHIDHLVVVDIRFVGFLRNYSAYISRGDPIATVQGTLSVVNLSSNAYELFQDLNVIKAADGTWSEPPDYPGLTNAYFNAVEASKDQVLVSFRQ